MGAGSGRPANFRRPAGPVPPGLATVLLSIAPLLITADIRPGLFAAPVDLPGPASPAIGWSPSSAATRTRGRRPALTPEPPPAPAGGPRP